MTDTATTVAWQQLKDVTAEKAAQYRENGASVYTAYADHGTVVTSDQPTFVFTVPDNAADELETSGFRTTNATTVVSYTDAGGVRLYLLVCRDNKSAVLIAGGIRHDQIESIDASPGASARTTVRRIDDTPVLQLDHDQLAPFVSDLRDS